MADSSVLRMVFSFKTQLGIDIIIESISVLTNQMAENTTRSPRNSDNEHESPEHVMGYLLP